MLAAWSSKPAHLGATVPPWYERFGAQESESEYAYRCVRKATDNLLVGVTSLRTMSDRFHADVRLKAAIERANGRLRQARDHMSEAAELFRRALQAQPGYEPALKGLAAVTRR